MSRVLRVVRRSPVIVAVVVVVVVGGGATAWALTRSSGAGAATTQVVAAKIATINQTVATSGTIAAAKEADLDFGASGRVATIKVKVGDTVTKGQVLATVSNTALLADYDAAKATVSSAKDKVTEDASTSSTSSTQLAADKAELTAARSQLSSARTAYHDAKLRSTIKGTVTTMGLTDGEAVTGSDTSGAGGGSGAGASAASNDSSSSSTAQVVVQSTKTYIVNASVDDTEVKTVKEGQPVTITPEGASTSVTGTVSSVSAVPSTSDDVVTFPLVVTVSGHPSGVYAGAPATLVITTKHVSNVLEIPTLAITYSGSTATVKVSSDGHTSTRTISAGTSYGLETQVVSGLKSGEKVVVSVPSFANFRRPGTGTGTRGFGGTGELGEGGGFGGGTGGTGGTGSTGTTGGFGGGGPGAFGSGSGQSSSSPTGGG